MQAVVNHGPEDYRLEEVPVPTRGPGEVLVKVEAVGICASDLKCYHGAAKFWGDANRPAWAETEVIPGHEFTGRVVELDDEAAAHWDITVGDRVVAEQIVPDWTCRYCLDGAYHMCARHDMYGFKRATPGAMASYMVFTTDSLVHKVSADIPPAHAAFAEPLSCALHGVERARLTFD
ncbi:MAG: erythritol/L-threitol dehydrogenase, partial [Propionibacteriaceae bacterium]